MKNKKALIWIGVASALLIGGGIFWWVRTRKPSGEDKSEKEEQAKKEEEAKGGGSTTTTTPPAPSLPPTPFKNEAEGNVFRAWMNKNHSDFRYNGDVLDAKGGFDNAFMRKAWQMYGIEYAKGNTAPVSSKSGFRVGNKLYVKKSVANVYKYPNNTASNRLGFITQSATSQATFKSDANTKGYIVAVARYKTPDGAKEVVADVYIMTGDVTNVAP